MIAGTSATQLSAAQRQYLAEQMQKVSRSFALVAPAVEPPLNDYLAAAYLTCRVADNIEDAQRPFAWQQERFQEFRALLEQPQGAAATLARWEALLWPGLTADEQRMMGRETGLALWEIYGRMPAALRAVIGRWVAAMADGMAQSNDPQTDDFFTTRHGVRLPRTVADYNRYCYHVAGTVGHMLSDLAIEFYGISGAAKEVMDSGCESCGRALQKTNVIKDYARDLTRGVSYLPLEWQEEAGLTPLTLAGAPPAWTRKVLLDVTAELEASAGYVLAIPQRAAGFRQAALLMLLPAYETILLAARQLPLLFTSRHEVKISRSAMGQCVLRARAIAPENVAIRKYTEEMARSVKWTLYGQ